MANAPFVETDAKPRGLLARLAKGVDHDAAARAIANLYATTPPEKVRPEQLSEVVKLHAVVVKDIDRVRIRVYTEALRVFLADRVLSTDESDYLVRLARSLGLSEQQRAAALVGVAEPLFQKAVEAAVSDNELTNDEMNELTALGGRLGLTRKEQDALRVGVVKPLVERALKAALADGRYTPREEESFHALCKRLHVNPQVDDAIVGRARTLAAIDAGQFPEVWADVALQKNEVAHFRARCSWAEMRTVTERVNYSGTTVSIPIMKGVRYRVGSVRPERVTREILHTVDEGEFYLTSKRLIFRGNRGNKVLTYASMLGLELYADGIKIQKSTGRPPILLFDGDTEMAAAMLSAKLAGA